MKVQMTSATHTEATLIIMNTCEHLLWLVLCMCDLNCALEHLCEAGCGITEHVNHR